LAGHRLDLGLVEAAADGVEVDFHLEETTDYADFTDFCLPLAL